MAIRLRCTCGHHTEVPDALAGKRLLCEQCRRPLRVPDGDAPIGQVKEVGRRRRKSADEPATPSQALFQLAIGAGSVFALAGVIALVVVLTRSGSETADKPPDQVAAAAPVQGQVAPDAATQPAPAQPVSPPSPMAAQPAVPAPMPPAPDARAPDAPALTDAEKRLRAAFNVGLVLFGPARFAHTEYEGRPWTGVIVEIEGLVPEAVGRFDAAAATARTATGADVSAAIHFTAGGREGLAAMARTLPNSVGKSGDIMIGKERFQPWPVGTFGRSVRDAKSTTADTGRVHLPPGATAYRTGDFLVAIPVILESGGGIEYGFIPGKKVRMGFLFPAGAKELVRVQLLGHHLDLEPGKRSGDAVAGQAPGAAPAPNPADPAPPKDGSMILEEIDRIVTPITDPIANRVKEYFVPERVAFAPDGKEFAGIGQARAVWSSERKLIWGKDERGETVSYSADGAKIYFVGDSQLTTYDRKSGKATTIQLGQPSKSANANPLQPFVWKGVDIRDGAVVSPSGKAAYAPTADVAEQAPGKLAYSAFSIRAYETTQGKELRKFPAKHSAWVSCLALSPDGKQLLSGSEDHTVRLWEAATGKELKVLKGHTARVVAVGWSGDGKRIVTAAEEYDSNLLKQLIAQKKPTEPARMDGTVRVWDAAGTELFQIKALVGLSHAFLSRDGRFVAVGRTIWEVGQDAPRYQCPMGSFTLLAFAPDGRTLLAGAREGYRGPNEPTTAIVRYRFPERIGAAEKD